MKKYLLILLLMPILSNSQWKTRSGSNKFDGNYKSAYVVGNGGKWPHTKPNFVINLFESSDPNIYLSGVGYTGCNNNTLLFSFDNENEIYYCYRNSTNSDNDTVFIDRFENLSIIDFIDLLKSKNKMQLRFSNSCGMDDYEFTLSGSTRALNYVLGDLFNKEDKEIEEDEEVTFKERYTKFLEDFECGNKMSSVRHAFVLKTNKNVAEVEFNSKFADVSEGDNLQFFNIFVDEMVFVKLHRGPKLILEDFITLEQCLKISGDPRFKIMFDYLKEISNKTNECM